MTPEPGAAAIDEVVALHAFFEAWFRGTLPNDDASYARFVDALAQDFEIVPPSGALVPRDALLTSLRALHATRDATFAIEVREARARTLTAGVWLVTYEEWQRDDADAAWGARRSSAVLEEDGNAPGGFRWRHVHETALP